MIAAKTHPPSQAPRRVTVERRRRAYEALDIEQLLIERGIDYHDPSFEAKSWWGKPPAAACRTFLKAALYKCSDLILV